MHVANQRLLYAATVAFSCQRFYTHLYCLYLLCSFFAPILSWCQLFGQELVQDCQRHYHHSQSNSVLSAWFGLLNFFLSIDLEVFILKLILRERYE